MSRRRNGNAGAGARREKGGRDPVEAGVDSLVAGSRPAPEPVQDEVRAALDRLGAIFRADRALIDALKAELGVRLLTADSPDVFVYGLKGRPQRLILLNCIERDGGCRVDPAAVHGECAHALRSLFHPIENPMLQEFFGALGPILSLDRRRMSGGPLLEVAETFYRMRHEGGHFTGIPDALAAKLRKFLPPNILAGTKTGGGNEEIASGFLEHSITHLIPMIAAESMADTGHLAELMDRYRLLLLPPKEISGILDEYGRRCATDPEWKEKFSAFRKVCGYHLRPETAPTGI